VISQRDLIKLSAWAKKNNARIVFELEGKYNLAINKYLHAEDKAGSRVSWNRAFGPLPPSEVLSRFKVQRIVFVQGGQEREFSLKELKKLLESL